MRPADVIGAAVMVGRIATGEIEEGVGVPPEAGWLIRPHNVLNFCLFRYLLSATGLSLLLTCRRNWRGYAVNFSPALCTPLDGVSLVHNP
jgi:hypothetical protein